ncbi:MAG: putative selenium-dependent hydroxylase accessory protein YqeC, partial [Deltaproteobacteria bacterium]|nr:putative selenium-dependent hydroxylase accessory protein YqeC [Deltaproteobacteria bacterium]
KVEGISPKRADAMFQEPLLDYLIVEADGAAHRPVKAPAQHEPVIPSSATVVVALMGLEAMGKDLGEEMVFRPERFERITGLVPGERLTPEILSRLFLSPKGLFKGSPPTARLVAFLNKVDLVGEEQGARELAGLVLKDAKSPIDRVVIGSVVKGRYAIIYP